MIDLGAKKEDKLLSLATFRVEIGIESPSPSWDVDKEESMPYQFQKGDLAEYNGPGLDEATAEQRLLAARSLLVRTFFPSFLLSTQEKLSIFGFLLAIL